jgi:DNA-directed RNA polymerase subunit E'
MFYIAKVKDHVRVEPTLFALPVKESVKKQLEKTYENFIDEELGSVISVLEVSEVKEGILISGDAAAYYASEFSLLVFKPVLHELVFGEITEITNFGAFMNLGTFDAMIHISQTMEDFVSFSKTGTLIGKNSKRVLKKGDLCLARIVAISFKTVPPKIGLTMRQPGLGKLEWIQEDKKRTKAIADKMAKATEREEKKGKKSKEKEK